MDQGLAPRFVRLAGGKLRCALRTQALGVTKSITVGVLSPVTGGFYYGKIVAGIAREVAAVGGHVVLIQTLDAGLGRDEVVSAPYFATSTAWDHTMTSSRSRRPPIAFSGPPSSSPRRSAPTRPAGYSVFPSWLGRATCRSPSPVEFPAPTWVPPNTPHRVAVSNVAVVGLDRCWRSPCGVGREGDDDDHTAGVGRCRARAGCLCPNECGPVSPDRLVVERRAAELQRTAGNLVERGAGVRAGGRQRATSRPPARLAPLRP